MNASEHTPKIFEKGLLVIVIFLSVCNAYSQDQRLSMQLRQLLFTDFVDTLEKSVPVKIYYSDVWTDSLLLDINADNSTFDELFNSTLRKEGFTFIITDENKIILSKGYSIKTDFRDEYLEYLRLNATQRDTAEYQLPPGQGEEIKMDDEFRLFRIGHLVEGKKEGTAILAGKVINSMDGQPMTGVIIYVEKLKIGVMTNEQGYYSIMLPKGQYQIEYRLMGMQSTRRNVIIYSNGNLDVEMNESTSEVEAVVVTGKYSNVKDVRTGVERINTKMLKQIPMGLGEVDVLKSTLLLPGVQTVGEASAGFNVRGGNTDQNLVFLNNAPIINSSHFFGFFSSFNSDLVSDVTLYKSGIPAKYGGRLSSVIDIVPAEGNNEKLKVSGGISPVTGRIMIEGPLNKYKSTYILGTRATYSDWLLKLLKDYRLKNSKAGFYDIQGMVKTEINEKNTLYLTGYLSNDIFDYYSECAFNYGNSIATLKWAHSFSPKLSVQSYLISSNYRYQYDTQDDSTHYNSMKYRFNQMIIRSDFLYYPSGRHKVEFGVDATYYSLVPGIREPIGDYSEYTYQRLERETAEEPSLYLSDEYEITPLLSLSAGIRTTFYTCFGPKTEYRYYDGVTRSVESITDTVRYSPGEIVKFYPGVDLRFSSRLILTPGLSLKMGVQRVHQYIHMISNTTSISPTDIWKLSDRYIKPQRSDQISLGLYGTLFGKKPVEVSVEGYYKRLTNTLDYKSGAVLLMNEHLETDVINGNGTAYGVEFLLKKQYGSLTGWLSYTYSRILMKVDGPYELEKVNDGEYFPADYDKPHDLKFVANAKLSRRFNLTTNFNYSTGRPITYPVAFYSFNNSTYVYYSKRNEYRIPDYIRLDLSVTVNGNLKAKKLNHSSFTFTIYNLLGRDNPYSIYFRSEEGVLNGYKMTIFSRPVFMVTYNFRILGNATGDF